MTAEPADRPDHSGSAGTLAQVPVYAQADEETRRSRSPPAGATAALAGFGEPGFAKIAISIRVDALRQQCIDHDRGDPNSAD